MNSKKLYPGGGGGMISGMGVVRDVVLIELHVTCHLCWALPTLGRCGLLDV